MATVIDDEARITDTGKRALVMMAQRGVSLHPKRYAVWFEYCLGVNENLVKDLNQILEEWSPPPPHLHDCLYDKYFCDKRGEEITHQAADETQTILKNILERLVQFSRNSVEDQNVLGQCSVELRSAKDLSQVQTLIEQVVNRTNMMVRSSRDLQQRLAEESARAENLRAMLEQTKREALTDPLTGLYNRKALDRKIEELLAVLRADGPSFSVLMLDVDHFKRVNDTYGHIIGDAVLRVVAKTIAQHVRGGDFAARYGGEEFAVLLPKTPLDNAVIVADNIRKGLETNRFKIVNTERLLPVITVSVGVSMARREDVPEFLFERADKALYQAKNSGRNTVRTLR